MKNFSVKAIIRADKQKQNGKCPIYIRVTIEKKQLKLPTPLETEPADWNAKEGIFKETKSSVKNSALKKRVNEIEDFLLKHIAAENEITIELVKNNFTKQKNTAFYVFLNDFIEYKFRTIKPGTQNHYRLVERRLKEFNPNLNITDLDDKFPLRFEKFLIKKEIGVDGIWQHHKNMKTIINYGLKRKVLNENPYLDFKVKKGKQRIEALTIDQVRAIRDLKIVIGPKRKNMGLDSIRDMFLLSCYTSLRFGDVMQLTTKHIIDNTYISIVQEKTGSIVNIPLAPESLELIEKNKCPGRSTIFPQRKNQTCNRGLKRIAEMCDIDINVHFHLARHSFGSIMARKLTAFDLSKTMGHSNIKTTMIYVNSNINDIREQMLTSRIFG
jgi:integrase/recombinase XerD